MSRCTQTQTDSGQICSLHERPVSQGDPGMTQGLVPDLKKFIQGKLFSDYFFTLLSHLEKSLHRRINAILISIGHFVFFLLFLTTIIISGMLFWWLHHFISLVFSLLFLYSQCLLCLQWCNLPHIHIQHTAQTHTHSLRHTNIQHQYIHSRTRTGYMECTWSWFQGKAV